MSILFKILFFVVATIFILFIFSKKGRIFLLHSLFEVGSTAEKRFSVASKMYRLAISDTNNESRLDSLHKTLDVILMDGKFDTIPTNTKFHRDYWELGHKTAVEIKKLQEQLNIDSFWFENDYESAMKMIK